MVERQAVPKTASDLPQNSLRFPPKLPQTVRKIPSDFHPNFFRFPPKLPQTVPKTPSGFPQNFFAPSQNCLRPSPKLFTSSQNTFLGLNLAKRHRCVRHSRPGRMLRWEYWSLQCPWTKLAPKRGALKGKKAPSPALSGPVGFSSKWVRKGGENVPVPIPISAPGTGSATTSLAGDRGTSSSLAALPARHRCSLEF